MITTREGSPRRNRGFTNMPDAYTSLESSFQASPNFKTHKSLRRRTDELRSLLPSAEPLKPRPSYHDDEFDSQGNIQDRASLVSPSALNGADTGLPPTPPSNSLDEQPPTTFSPPPHADGVVSSLLSRKSSISAPISQRSPPTPDPSPPRTTESISLPERPPFLAYPSSRAESFKTAREDQFSSDGSDSRSGTPLADRLSTVTEERGLGLAFERDDNDPTPTNKPQEQVTDMDGVGGAEGRQDPLKVENIPDREWDTNLMRNVTVRRKRNPKPSPQKNPDSTTASATPPTESRHRRSSSLRERVEASKNSPHTPSIENFAQSIGWPTENTQQPNEQPRDVDPKRLSGSSMASTVVEAMVIVTPPQKRRPLRHSGRNLAYREDGDSFTDRSSLNYSNRNSLNSDDIPLHRLVHKRANINDQTRRISSESGSMGLDRSASLLSVRKRTQDSARYTLAHQESVRRVLQPAADILSRSNSLSRPYSSERSYHKRISSAPEPSPRAVQSPGPRTFLELSPPESPKPLAEPFAPALEPGDVPRSSPKARPSSRDKIQSPININKSLPDLPTQSTDLPIQSTNELDSKEDAPVPEKSKAEDEHLPAAFHDALSEQPIHIESPQAQNTDSQEPPPPRRRGSSADSAPSARRGSLSTRGRSEERRRSSVSRDRASTSRDRNLRPSLDRTPTEELPRRSYEWRSLHAEDHRRMSFDRSTSRSDEHAMARHLFAQTTPFSQFSDTPIEVSEATAVSIYPHNNHSLLVVQQVARSSTLPFEEREITDDPNRPSSDPKAPEMASSALLLDVPSNEPVHLDQPTVTIEPSTPPMQISLPVPEAVDSPLKNPRAAPEPPSFKVIPPTPMEELERQLPPGPPKRSDSHPQRRLSLVQRARRYSDNLISPLLARASSTRGRAVSESHTHEKPHPIPTVNDEEGTLHPFWRPRGFWDGFEDTDSESDEDVLPQGGDTSEVTEPSPEPSPRKLGVLGRRLTNGFKGSGGFLIGNSLGVERSGTNRRRPQINLPSRRSRESPKILIQPPTLPLRSRSPRIEKRGSRASMRSAGSYERPRRGSRRDAWRQGKRIPGVGLQVQYIGLSGVKQRLRERKAEKRRQEIRRSIGSRYYVEGGANVA